MFYAGQVKVKEGRSDDRVSGDVLQLEVQHLDADTTRHLREILPGNFDPLGAIPDQETPAAGVAAKVVTESGCQAIITRGVLFYVFVKQRPNPGLAAVGQGIRHQ
jgi:hypothetical protein